eukprot:4989258-Karenia_brevis.AAC.1
MPINFWFEQRAVNDGKHTTPTCCYTPYHILDNWDRWPQDNECYNCWLERKRRARVLYVDARAAHAKERLTDAHFANAVLITQYNVAVYFFAQQRALNFAHSQNLQSFWIQASDAPPVWYANGYTKPELLEQKKRTVILNSERSDFGDTLHPPNL